MCFQQFPLDIQVYIWKYNDLNQLLFNLRVCKQWCSAMKSATILWKLCEKFVNVHKTTRFLVHYTQYIEKQAWRLKYCTGLEWDGFFDDGLLDQDCTAATVNWALSLFCEQAVNLIHVTLYKMEQFQMDAFLELPHLRSLQVTLLTEMEDMVAAEYHVSAMTVLEVRSHTQDMYSIPERLLPLCPNLQQLVLQCDEYHVGAAIRQMPNLTQLTLITHLWSTTEYANELPWSVNSMRALHEVVKNTSVVHLKLHVSGMEEWIQTAAEWLPFRQICGGHLRSLELKFFHNYDLSDSEDEFSITDVSQLFSCIAHCSGLEELVLEDEYDMVLDVVVSREHLMYLSTVSATLVRLIFKGIRIHTNAAADLCKLFPKLNVLSVEIQPHTPLVKVKYILGNLRALTHCAIHAPLPGEDRQNDVNALTIFEYLQETIPEGCAIMIEPNNKGLIGWCLQSEIHVPRTDQDVLHSMKNGSIQNKIHCII